MLLCISRAAAAAYGTEGYATHVVHLEACPRLFAMHMTIRCATQLPLPACSTCPRIFMCLQCSLHQYMFINGCSHHALQVPHTGPPNSFNEPSPQYFRLHAASFWSISPIERYSSSTAAVALGMLSTHVLKRGSRQDEGRHSKSMHGQTANAASTHVCVCLLCVMCVRSL